MGSVLRSAQATPAPREPPAPRKGRDYEEQPLRPFGPSPRQAGAQGKLPPYHWNVPEVAQLTDPSLGSRFGGGAPAGLRARTARGTIINAAFLVGGMGLGFIQSALVARLLPTSVIGRFELLMAAFMTLLALGQVGVDDKYIQQSDPDQQRAFEIAFTLQWLVAGALVVLLLIGTPLFAVVYGQPKIIVPGIALIATLPALALQMPLWAHYRRMDFVRQRSLMMLNTVVGFVAVVALLLAGLQLWALVLSGIIASWVAAAACVRSAPYRLRLRWDRSKLAEYKRFSWPLFLGTLTGVIQWQVPVTVAARTLGASAVAGIALSMSIMQLSMRADGIITTTLYPAVCAVKDRADLLLESFWKSNRLAMLWAAPVGCAAALFISDFVHFVIGEKWRFAVPLLAITGVSAALNQVGFNWTAFFRATGETRPVAVNNTISLVAMLAIAVPLLGIYGVTGFGVGVGAVTLVTVTVRVRYLRRLFPGFPMTRHVLRGMGPALVATAMILAIRAADGRPRTLVRMVVEAILFAAVTSAITAIFERKLIAEVLGYVRRRTSPAAALT